MSWNWKEIAKFFAATVMMALWAFLAFQGKTPMEGFIAMLRDALIGLGIFGATMANRHPPAPGNEPPPDQQPPETK